MVRSSPPRTVVAAETQYSAHEHSPVNAAMIDALADAFPESELKLAAAVGHHRALADQSSTIDRWSHAEMQPSKGGSPLSARKMISRLNRLAGSDSLVVNLNSSVAHLTVASLGLAGRRWWNAVHLSPGELAGRVPLGATGPVWRGILRLRRFSYYDTRVLEGDWADWSQRLIGLGHPIRINPRPWPTGDRPVLGLFGAPSNYIDRLEELFSLLGEDAARADWPMIGFTRDPELQARAGALGLAAPSEPLTPEDYARRAGGCHAGIWLNDPETYQARASGSLIDPLSAGRPVIGLDCGFNRLTMEACGVPGRLAPDVAGVAQAIREDVLGAEGPARLRKWGDRLAETEPENPYTISNIGRRMRQMWDEGF